MAKERLFRISGPQKNMLFKALADELGRQEQRGILDYELAWFAHRVDTLPQHRNIWPWSRKQQFDLYLTDKEWRVARNALNELRNWRFSVGKGDGGTSDALLQLIKAGYRTAPIRQPVTNAADIDVSGEKQAAQENK